MYRIVDLAQYQKTGHCSDLMWKLGEKYRIFIGLARDRTRDLCEHVHGLSVQTTTPLAQFGECLEILFMCTCGDIFHIIPSQTKEVLKANIACELKIRMNVSFVGDS